MSRRVGIWCVVGLVALHAVILLALLVQPGVSSGRGNIAGGIQRYREIAVADGVPYRDDAVEYPPVTYAAIRVLAAGDVVSGARAVAVFSFLCDVAVVGALLVGWGRRAAIAYLVADTAFLIYPVIYLRLDLLSIALALWGLALVRRARPTPGGIVLGVAVFTKLWPVLLIPLLATTRRLRSAVAAGVAAAVGLAGWALVGGLDGLRQVATFRGADGWQIESVGGGFVRLLVPSPVYFESGAYRVGTIPPGVRTGLTVGLVATVVVILVACALGSRRYATLDRWSGMVDGVAPIALVAAMLTFAPLFSPQFAVWLLPFAAIAWAEHEREIAIGTFVVTTMSALLLGRIEELKNGGAIEMAVVVTRNVMVVILLVVAIGRIVQWARAKSPLGPGAPTADTRGLVTSSSGTMV